MSLPPDNAPDVEKKEILAELATLKQRAALLEAEILGQQKAAAESQLLELKLRSERDQLQQLIENTPECVKLVAQDGTVLAMNNAGLRMVEARSAQEVVGRSVYDLIAPEHRDMFKAMNARVCAGSKEHLEFDIINLNGTRRQMETTSVPLANPEGSGKVQLALTRDVSDQKRIAGSLRESEQKYKMLFDSIDQGFSIIEVLFDETGMPVDYRFEIVNPAFERQTGIRNAVGRRMRDIAPNHEEYWFQNYGRIASTGEAMRFENRAGQLGRDYEVFAWHVGESDSRKVGILFNDVTARKKTEDALRRTELRWRTVAETQPNLVWTASADGQCDWLSSRWGLYTGIPEGELLGMHWLERVIHPDDREITLRCWQAACEGQAQYDLEYRIRGHDGGYRWFKTRGVPVRDGDDETVNWFGTCTDIEDMKQAAASAQRLAAIVESSDDAIISKDLNGIISSWNKGAKSVFGYDAEEMIGKPVTLLIPADRLDEEPGILQRIRDGQNIDHYETLRRRKDGTLIDISLTISPIRDAKGKIVGASKIARDITDKVRAKAKLEQIVSERTASLQEAIAQMEEFSYTVSHDLRAPLRGMQAYSEALLQDFAPPLPPRAIDYVRRIMINAKRLDRMVIDLLTFSRLGRAELKLEPINLDQLLRRIVEEYPGMQTPASEITIHPLPPVVGHEPSLTQVFSNLLNNAIKFVPPEITPTVVVSAERMDGIVRISVKDNGVGVDPSIQHRLFKMFERCHPQLKKEGTGVGLAIVRKAVERMNGSVGIVSDGKNGSEFWIELPAAAGADADFS